MSEEKRFSHEQAIAQAKQQMDGLPDELNVKAGPIRTRSNGNVRVIPTRSSSIAMGSCFHPKVVHSGITTAANPN